LQIGGDRRCGDILHSKFPNLHFPSTNLGNSEGYPGNCDINPYLINDLRFATHVISPFPERVPCKTAKASRCAYNSCRSDEIASARFLMSERSQLKITQARPLTIVASPLTKSVVSSWSLIFQNPLMLLDSSVSYAGPIPRMLSTASTGVEIRVCTAFVKVFPPATLAGSIPIAPLTALITAVTGAMGIDPASVAGG